MITRRQFNQGVAATAIATAVPLIPTAKAERHWYLYQVPIEHWGLPDFEMRLIENGKGVSLYQVKNLTGMILRLEGYDATVSELQTIDVIELQPHGTYDFAASTWMRPRFDLVAKYQWRFPCDCIDGPHGTACSNRNVLRPEYDYLRGETPST